MERQCKIGGKSLRNRDVVNKDRISELPEALLLHILSSLPTRIVIATSVLSKRWKSIWKMMPNLNFDSLYIRKFPENVCSTLILHKAPVLESLNLLVRYECDPLEMGLPIAIAFSRNVRKMVMKLDVEDDVIFPSLVFRCYNTLEILKLMGSILVDLTSPVCLNSLRELQIYDVNFKNEESFSNLLCGCPRLQDLVVHQDYYIGERERTFTIELSSLHRLTLEINNATGRYVINAPSLKYLNIDFYDNLRCCLIENALELVEAKIYEGAYTEDNTMDKNILKSLISTKRLFLYLSPLKIKYLAGKIFYQLISLELLTNNENWVNLLTLMLDSSPKLQILKLMDNLSNDYNKSVLISQKWNQPKCVPECLLFHLETFVWTNYKWEREDEKEVATYIVKNARHLKKATFSTAETTMPEKRREMLNQLTNEVRISNSCHLVFEFGEYYCRQTDDDFDECIY